MWSRAGNESHIQAAAFASGESAESIAAKKAPPSAHFEEELQACRLGDASIRATARRRQFETLKREGAPSNVAGTGLKVRRQGFEKARRLRATLGEAKRRMERKFLASAEFIVYQPDTKGKRLSLYYAAADSNMQVRFGLLGQCNICKPHLGKDATGLEKGIKQVMRDFCTPYKHVRKVTVAARYRKTGLRLSQMPCNVNLKLLKHIRSTAKGMSPDGASDIQLAAKMLKQEWLPRVSASKDRTHAMRRVLKRPWDADAYCREVYRMFVSGKKCMTQTIQNSDQFKQTFAELIRDCGDLAAKVGNYREDSAEFRASLRCAKHRVESLCEPLRRVVVYWEAYLSVVIAVARERRSQPEGKRAMEFLAWVDEEALVQLAMMADAAEQLVCLLRFFDADGFDPSSMAAEVALFVSRVDFLFVQGQCIDHGYRKGHNNSQRPENEFNIAVDIDII